ncbi:MAG: hypothetical protein PHE83_04055 [Opitutaceae bacterium]|nr:hypothetical protein [Opitutaceae bacterium]
MLSPSITVCDPTPVSSPPACRRVRSFCYCPWAGPLVETGTFLRQMEHVDIALRVANPADPGLLQLAQLDRDWHAENVRVFAAMAHPEIDFLPAHVLGARGLSEFVSRIRPPEEEWWLILTGQHPRHLAGVIGRTLAYLAHRGVRMLYYAFDEASRNLECFNELAPHLDVLIHDEAPLAEAGRAALAPRCLTLHRSWVANLRPYAAPFVEQPEEKILFLGSQLGFTPHRRRQVEFLQTRFKDRLVAIHDHSVPVGERLRLARYQAGFCPEGRMFTTPGMRATHTDRPFWSGCLGLVPVAEDSREGGRLEVLHQAGLIHRYRHGDLEDLARACEAALALPAAARRRIYDHFNRHETIGTVVAAAIHAAGHPGAAGSKAAAPVSALASCLP